MPSGPSCWRRITLGNLKTVLMLMSFPSLKDEEKTSNNAEATISNRNTNRPLKGGTRHFRHRFAVMALLRWYRSDEDVERRLPFLSAYLGHVHVSDTYWYLSARPELMQEAMSRLERCWEGQS